MARKGSSLALLTLLVAAAAGGNLLADGAPADWISDRAAPVVAPVASQTARLVAALTGSGDAGRGRELEAELVRLTRDNAAAEQALRDAAFYRAAAELRERTGRPAIEAGIVAYRRAGGAMEFTVNRGVRDWVAEGDSVVTADGALVGIVTRVRERSAVVTALGDPALDVAARIADTEVTGLVRPAGDDTLILDLVRKGEPVTEGQRVLTSGADYFPPGLVIGTVRSVAAEGTALFSVVRLDPAADERVSRVLIIRP